jgi:TatD DNase family protein
MREGKQNAGNSPFPENMNMIPRLVDAHTHLQFENFDKDRDETIKRALDEDIWIVNAGANKKLSKQAVEIAEKYPVGVWATVGLHPDDAKEGFDYEFYKGLAQKEKAVGIGECGLDYYRSQEIKNTELRIQNLESQKEIFIKQIELAKEINKPLVIHCRQAFADLIEILESNKKFLNNPPGIIHFFTGTEENAEKLLEMGFYFTFGGLITYNRDFDGIIKKIPIERIMVETDAPFVSPAPFRGQRNEPLYVEKVAEKMAEIKNISLEEVCEKTTANAIDIFKLKA